MNLFRRPTPQTSPEAWTAARTAQSTIDTLRRHLDEANRDVARLSVENCELARANLFVATELNRARQALALVGRTGRGQFKGRVA